MKLIQLKRIAGVGLLAGSSVLLVSCGGGGGGGLVAPVCDASGNWDIGAYITTSSSYCASDNGTYKYITAVITQSGNTLNVTVSGTTFTGTISGSTVSWRGSYPDTGGTTSETLSGTVDATCSTITGTTSWTWTDGTGSCSGSTSFTGYGY